LFLLSGCSWNLTGNARTLHNRNFLGTTDSQPLVFKTNNNEAARIDANGSVRIGTTNASTTDKLSVNGTIQSMSGGFKFPDGTVQTKAASGLSGLNVVESSSCNGSGAQIDFPVFCRSGQVAIGGGGYIQESGCGSPEAYIGQIFLTRSWPLGNPPNGWRITAADAPGSPNNVHWKLVGHAICVDAPPP
jgi:hypothetical protein